MSVVCGNRGGSPSMLVLRR